MSQIKIALIIPTKDRPEDMKRLLESIVSDQQPFEIIVVDGSDSPIKDVTDQFSDLPIKYVRVRPPSLPKQRNAGIDKLSADVNWVGFLDDDLVLDADCLQELEKFLLAQNEIVKGVGLTIKNQPLSSAYGFNKFFLLGGAPGKVTSSGFASSIPIPEESIDVDWLYGGATFWKKEVFEEFRYDEWFQGTGYLEDVDFSYRVSRKYHLKVCAQAKCLHLSHPVRRSKQVGLGAWQITSWWYFVKKYNDFSYPLVFWSMLGLFAKNIFIGLVRLSPDALLRAWGNLKGISSVFFQKGHSTAGFSK